MPRLGAFRGYRGRRVRREPRRHARCGIGCWRLADNLGLSLLSAAQIIGYLVEENRILKEQLGGKRLRLTDDQRRRLAATGKALGRRLLVRVATIVTPDTIMRWHRRLIAARWTYPSKRVGRPGIMKAIRALIVRMATDNPSWGYCRIQGELKKVSHQVARSTIPKTLKEHGMSPSPQRPHVVANVLEVARGGDRGDRLLLCRDLDSARLDYALRAVRRRSRHSRRSYRRDHDQPHRGLDHPGRPQPVLAPRRPARQCPGPRARPGKSVHRRLR